MTQAPNEGSWMKRIWLGALVAVVVVLGFKLYRCDGADTRVVVRLPPGAVQPRVSPGEAGIDPAALAAAVEYAGARNTSALLVGRGGHIVYEKYWGDTTPETAVELSGFTPVLAALASGSVMNDRLIVDLDAPLSNYVHGMDRNAPRYPATLRQILAQDDPASEADADLLADALANVTGASYQTIVAERLWKPLEGGDLSFERRQANGKGGGARAGCCLRARLGDWMRVGELLANDGVFEGNQLTPPHYVTLMLTPAHRNSPRGFFTRVDGRFATHDVARLEAEGKQRLWIVPSLKLVILRVGAEPSGSRGWDEAMIPDTIIRGTSGWQTPQAGADIQPKNYAPH